MNGRWVPRRGAIGVAALGIFVVVGAVSGTTGPVPTAAAAPATDAGGFVDSTARCVAPSRAVAFGYTASSRLAVCKDDASGQYQYRGVRVSDGARLILAATSTDHGYVAENEGSTYTVTATALTITAGGQQIRDEPMLDFHGTAGSSTSASSTAASSSSSSTSVQPSAAPPTVTTPLPPPLPAEVGGGRR